MSGHYTSTEDRQAAGCARDAARRSWRAPPAPKDIAVSNRAESGMTSKIWFITGTSRGFGREWALAALERGDRVAATARDAAALDDLVAVHRDAVLPIALDVTDRDAVRRAVDLAVDHFGRLDIVVNNAGYGQFGMVEEITEEQARAQMETNLFGALWVTQAALPHLRAGGGGTSCRCPRSAGSPRSRASASTTPRSGRWRG